MKKILKIVKCLKSFTSFAKSFTSFAPQSRLCASLSLCITLSLSLGLFPSLSRPFSFLGTQTRDNDDWVTKSDPFITDSFKQQDAPRIPNTAPRTPNPKPRTPNPAPRMHPNPEPQIPKPKLQKQSNRQETSGGLQLGGFQLCLSLLGLSRFGGWGGVGLKCRAQWISQQVYSADLLS